MDRYFDVPRLRCEVDVPLADQPGLGHNRRHPEIPPAIEIGPGEEVILEPPAYDDHQIHDNSDMEELRHVDLTRMHPLAGPVRVARERRQHGHQQARAGREGVLPCVRRRRLAVAG